MSPVRTGRRFAPAARRQLQLLLALGALAAVAALAACRAGVTRGDILYAESSDRLAAGDTAAALAVCEQAAYESPNDARIQARLATLLGSQKDFAARRRAVLCWERAIALDPSSAASSAALGELLQAQGFWHDGQSALRRAVRLDPQLGHAWQLLGASYLRTFLEAPDVEAWRDSALACSERALALDSLDIVARYRVAVLAFARGDRDRARAVAAAGPHAGPAAARFALLGATLACRAGDDGAAAAALDTALARLPAAGRDSLLDPRRVQPPESIPACEPCTPDQRDSLALAFWWDVDPTPATPLNERLLEHVARCVEADFLFAVPILHRAGRDSDRGDIYIRFGAPDWMERDAEVPDPAWRWGYADLAGESEEFLFVDAMLNGSYWRWRRGAADDFMHPEALQRVPQLSRRYFGAPAPGWEHATYRFRNRDGGAALEVAFAYASTVPLDSVRVEFAAGEGWRARRTTQRSSFDPHQLHRRADGHAVGRVRLAVPCAPLVLGMQAAAWCAQADTDARHPEWWAATRDTIAPANCDTTQLGMSDLVPASALRRGDRGPFDLGGTTVIPALRATVDPGGALHLYFEVYPSAAQRAARHALDIGYRVQELPPRTWHFRDQFSAALRARSTRRSVVQSTFRLRPQRAIEPEPLSIDVRHLEPGDYVLTVEVRAAAGEQVERALEFTIPKRAPAR